MTPHFLSCFVLAYLGKYLNERARAAEPVDLCALIKKLRATDAQNKKSVHRFYVGMIEFEKGKKRMSVPEVLGQADAVRHMKKLEAQVRFLRLLEIEMRTRVSESSANHLLQYVDMLDAELGLLQMMNR